MHYTLAHWSITVSALYYAVVHDYSTLAHWSVELNIYVLQNT